MGNPRERKIPVFSVWKNDSILKNIFLINTPPPPSLDQIEVQEGEICKTQKEFEETLVIGRHPDCDIRLEHPSISRFHLRIHSIPSSTILSITDLSSVHGTWVSGKRIEPNVRTRLDEDDTLRIGGSSRIYNLHWIPFSQAYDMEHPFVPPFVFSQQREDEEEENIENDNSSGSENETVHLVNSILKCLEDEELVAEILVNEVPYFEVLESSSGDENSDVCDQKEIPLTDQMQNRDSEVSNDQNSGFASLFEDKIFEMSAQKDIQMQMKIAKGQHRDSEVCVLQEILCMSNENSVVQNENSEVLESDNFCLESLFKEENSEVCLLKEISQNPQMHENDSRQVVDFASDGLVPLFMGENWECTKEYNPLPITNEDESFVYSILDGLDHPFLFKTSKLLAHEYLPSAPPRGLAHEYIPSAPPHSLAHEYIPSAPPRSLAHEYIPSAPPRSLAHEYIPSAPPRGLAHEYIPSAPPHSLAGGSELSTEMIIENEKREEECSWNFWYGSHIDVFQETENRNVQKEVDISSTEECKDRKLWSFWSGNMAVECSSISDAEAFFSECENGSARHVCQSPEPRSSSKNHLRSPLMTSAARNSGCSIWSRRGKQESSPQVLTSSKTKGKKMKTNQENVKDENPISRALFHDQEEEEIFTPDKENFTPKTHRSMRKLTVLKEATRSNSGKLSLSKMTVSPDVSPASNKENYSPNVRPLLLKERKGERVPFQTLISESPQKSVSEACISDTTVRSEKSVTCPKPTIKTFLQEKCTGEKTRKWNMVVDTTTLLNKGSRQALQLLAGLKGTQLIIPRIVVKELESLKRQTSFFRRNSEVLSALDWIQDCIAENQWWVHLETSMEEGRAVAPTPRALTCGTPFFAFGSRAEVITPTPDDHVLDYALCFRKARNDGQLILLSNDLTLKIKAMAEGIICEGAEEFRESLVNPFSERFLWADSSPRGQTWCCSDDIVLKEKFYPKSLKIVPKAMENVKGLKLILLHNSQYFESMTGVLLH